MAFSFHFYFHKENWKVIQLIPIRVFSLYSINSILQLSYATRLSFCCLFNFVYFEVCACRSEKIIATKEITRTCQLFPLSKLSTMSSRFCHYSLYILFLYLLLINFFDEESIVLKLLVIFQLLISTEIERKFTVLTHRDVGNSQLNFSTSAPDLFLH